MIVRQLVTDIFLLNGGELLRHILYAVAEFEQSADIQCHVFVRVNVISTWVLYQFEGRDGSPGRPAAWAARPYR